MSIKEAKEKWKDEIFINVKIFLKYGTKYLLMPEINKLNFK